MALSAVLQAEHDQLTWTPVTSSNIEKVAYVPGIGRLWVAFHRKPGATTQYHVYAYDHVPPAAYSALLAAPSVGGYFAAQIKKFYAVTPAY